MATRKAPQIVKLDSTVKGGRLKSGQAPPIAASNAFRARSNVEIKLNYLSSKLAELSNNEGECASLLKVLPSSVAQFNRWSSKDIPAQFLLAGEEFDRGSNATLNKHLDVREAVVLCVRKISELKKGGKSGKNNEKVARFRDRLNIAVTLREIAERELVYARRELLEAKGEIIRLNGAIDSIVEAVNEEREQILKDVASLAKIYPEAGAILRGRVKLIGS